MIGTKYAIEPFFFSSSLNRIPSRYQENHGNSGDHITITLPFVRIVKHGLGLSVDMQTSGRYPEGALSVTHGRLEHELLAIHMVRSPQSSTLISFHPKGLRSSAAEHLQSRIMDAGYSVYWKEILESTKDPTFLLLIYLWYAFYAWDQAFEDLYGYINELETTTIVNFEISSAQTIHNVHAHLLNYALLLRDFEESVKFVLNTPNPTIEESLRTQEQERMERECKHLLSEISRLEMGRQIHTERLRNAMDLLFSSVNIKDSEQMQQLTTIAVRDSHAMKQVSILTMVFLPASFAASIFGMNVTNFDTDPNIKGTLVQYLGTAITLTAITIWIIVASQTNAPGSTKRERGWQRLAWPVHLLASIPPFCWIGPRQNDNSDDHAEVTGDRRV
ncbi:hypothetical protein BDZ94DRAFT_1259474 [Collybia nuda]|uniref:Magnesium transporter n=1 Tax=Collybia nuda TaxID=64659 RepID=A0A9P5Y491_9AGAR|nr:hypothetical protein BDZ94DRAFT_1259474 [Collybia nuda]